MQIILFDIDGTLITTAHAGQHAMREVVNQRQAAPDAEQLDKIHFAGRTDRAIVGEHLKQAGLEDNDQNYLEYSEQFLGRLPQSLRERDGRVLPGVVATLRRLLDTTNVRLGLLTGNMRRAARIKLEHFGLHDYFYADGDAFGGFGDNHHDRDDVARAALAEVHQVVSDSVAPEDVWIVGDTPRDVQCARAINARVLAVTTGSYDQAELAATEPDLLVRDLENADAWWNALDL